ncbi:MAG: F0F1 ATP synthase subunit A [Clostridia bacterium]|nr:F0F1 ATP synthase subunit A [Clostridia bacterium]
MNGAKIYFEIPIYGDIKIPVTQTMVSLLVVTILLLTLTFIASRNIKKRPGKLQVLVEKVVTMLYNLVESCMGKHNLKFAPYIGTLFCCSFFGSVIGMTAIFRSTTADLSVTGAWALITTGLVWYNNIKNNGFLGWLKGFTEPVVVMTPMNIVSEIANPVAMAFRHFGNVAGGSVLTALIYAALAALNNVVFGFLPEAIFAVMPPIFQVGIPAILSIYFDLFSGFVQAFVFCLLTMIYVGEASPPPATVPATSEAQSAEVAPEGVEEVALTEGEIVVDSTTKE